MATAAKFDLPIAIFLAYLIQLDVDVTGNITAKFCEVGSEFNIFCTLVTMATATFWFFSTPQKLPHTTVDIPAKFHEVWWKESKLFLNPPFFVFMATATKFVQQIPIFLAYLVPLDVDVVPIKFHQFLFVPTMFHEVWWTKSKKKLNPPFFISMATAAMFFLPIPIFFGLSRSTRCACDRKHYCKNLWSLEWIKHFLHLGYHGNGHHFDFFQPPKAATYYGGYSCKVSWSLMKGILIVFKSPLFCFHGNCDKVCPTDSDFFGLSRSTRCGCCSYQASSISSRRIIIVKKKRWIAIHHPTTVGVM